MQTSDRSPFSFDLWEMLQREERDILLYGMGNGADKLLAVCEQRGIAIAGIFASNGFVRGHSFHGMRVMPYSEVCEKYPEGGCVILLAFGSSRPEVLALFDAVAARYPLYVPDLPVCGSNLFDAGFYRAHGAEFDAARALLASDADKALFDRVIACKYTGEYARFCDTVSALTPWEMLTRREITAMADLGAYNGDSAREALEKCPRLRFILAAEPDKRNFKKLSLWSESMTACEIECRQIAVWDGPGEAVFDASGNRNAGLCTGRGGDTVQTDSLDRMLGGRRVDYIKYDVEGAEKEALLGCADSIRRHLPALRVALYHRSEDLFALPLLLQKLAPDAYDLHLARTPGVPCWDLDLIALPRQKK